MDIGAATKQTSLLNFSHGVVLHNATIRGCGNNSLITERGEKLIELFFLSAGAMGWSVRRSGLGDGCGKDSWSLNKQHSAATIQLFLRSRAFFFLFAMCPALQVQ